MARLEVTVFDKTSFDKNELTLVAEEPGAVIPVAGDDAPARA